MSLTCRPLPAAPSAVSARARGRGSGEGVDIIDTVDIVDIICRYYRYQRTCCGAGAGWGGGGPLGTAITVAPADTGVAVSSWLGPDTGS